MTSTERVMAAINFQTPDRLPVYDGYMPLFVERWHREKNLDATVNPADYYGIDVSICVADEAFFPSQRGLVNEDGDYEIRRDGWGRTIRVGKEDSYFMQTIDSVLKTPADLDHLEFEPATQSQRYIGFEEQVARERASGRCVFSKIGGLYIRTHFLRGEDLLLMDMITDKVFCDALFDRVLDHLTVMALETLKRTQTWETGLWIYDDMANSLATMFSPRLFERYFLPRYQRLISTCRKAGCKHFFLHSDGNIGPVLDLLLEAGFEGFNPLEPRCGLGLIELRKRYSKRMVFLGGVCNTQILPRGNRQEIEEHVRPLIELGREGGLILGSASTSQDISTETYDFYMSLIRKYGDYT